MMRSLRSRSWECRTKSGAKGRWQWWFPKADFKKLISAEDLRGFLAKFVADGTISQVGIPDTFIMVDQIPKTSVGKLI